MSLVDKIGNFFKEKGKGLAKGVAYTGLALITLLGIPKKADALQLEIYTEPWTYFNGDILQDGSPIQFIWVGNNGRIDDPFAVFGPTWTPAWSAWVASGYPPIGDDQLISSDPWPPSYGAPAEQGTWMGYAWTGNYLYDPYPPLPPDASIYLDPAGNITGAAPYVYVRVFEPEKIFNIKSWYGNSELGWVDVGSPVPWQVFLSGGITDRPIPWWPEPSILELLAAAGGVLGGAAYIRNRRAKKK